MKEVVQFLMVNPDVLEKVKAGTASLVGVSNMESQVIVEAFSNESPLGTSHYWA